MSDLSTILYDLGSIASQISEIEAMPIKGTLELNRYADLCSMRNKLNSWVTDYGKKVEIIEISLVDTEGNIYTAYYTGIYDKDVPLLAIKLLGDKLAGFNARKIPLGSLLKSPLENNAPSRIDPVITSNKE